MTADKPSNAEITFDAHGSKINIFQTLAKYSLPIPSPLLKFYFTTKLAGKAFGFTLLLLSHLLLSCTILGFNTVTVNLFVRFFIVL